MILLHAQGRIQGGGQESRGQGSHDPKLVNFKPRLSTAIVLLVGLGQRHWIGLVDDNV